MLITSSFILNGTASARLTLGRYFSVIFADAEVSYRPEIEMTVPTPIGRFDFETSVQTAVTAALGDVTPYRLFISYTNSNYELRLGLQQLNFGSAIILRPLRWFDRIDHLDPLQTTPGVYGLSGRFYFANNRIWVWGLMGNTSTQKWLPEPGARIEIGLPRSELALSFHHRNTDNTGTEIVPENRIGIDARWDIGIGLWTEGVVVKTGNRWEEQAMLGTDYTFALGNGLTLLAEHMINHGFSSWSHYSALSLNYPLTITDHLTQVTLFDWKKRNPYIYLAWQRTLDNWRFILAGFLQNGIQAGGVQLQAIFNH